MSEEVINKFAQKLACNEPKVRSRAVKKIRKWLNEKSKSRNGFKEDDLIKLWKGLHYCMWMSDKALVQEELAESLSKLVHAFSDINVAFRFISAYFKTQIREWNGIDKLRLDKFMMLMRKYLHQSFVLLRQNQWANEDIKDLVECLTTAGVIGSQLDNVPDGLRFHVADIYLEELTKVGANELDSEKTLLFLESYCAMLPVTKNKVWLQYVIKHIFKEIANQGFETITTREEQSNEGNNEDDDENDDSTTENRLKFDYVAISEKLFKLASGKKCIGRNRREIYGLVQLFQNLDNGIIPVTNNTVEVLSDASLSDIEDDAFNRLVSLEDKIVTGERHRKQELKRKNKSKNKDSEVGLDEPSGKKPKVAEKKVKNKFKGEEKDKIKEKKRQKEALNILKKKKKKGLDDSETIEDDILMDVSGDDEDSEDSDGDSKDDVVHIRNNEDLGDEDDESSNEEALVMPVSGTKKNQAKGQKNKKEKKMKSSKSEMSSLFEGGFFDSDEEYENEGEIEQISVKEKENETKKSNGRKDKKKKSPSNKKQSISNVSTLFEGGFIDSDEECESQDSKKGASSSTPVSQTKKAKTKSKGSVKKHNSSVDEDSPKKVKNYLDFSGEETVQSLEQETEVTESGKKRKKKKSSAIPQSDSVEVITVENGIEVSETEENTPKSSKKNKKLKNKEAKVRLNQSAIVVSANVASSKKRKRRKSDSDVNGVQENASLEEEVEIFIPNKKYKGKFKEWAEQQAIGASTSEGSSQENEVMMKVNAHSGEGKENRSQSKKSKAGGGQQFIVFDKILNTPPAFIKKSLLKATPKTEPKKMSKKEVTAELPNSAGKRRVSFGLHKNMEHSTTDMSSSSEIEDKGYSDRQHRNERKPSRLSEKDNGTRESTCMTDKDILCSEDDSSGDSIQIFSPVICLNKNYVSDYVNRNNSAISKANLQVQDETHANQNNLKNNNGSTSKGKDLKLSARNFYSGQQGKFKTNLSFKHSEVTGECTILSSDVDTSDNFETLLGSNDHPTHTDTVNHTYSVEVGRINLIQGGTEKDRKCVASDKLSKQATDEPSVQVLQSKPKFDKEKSIAELESFLKTLKKPKKSVVDAAETDGKSDNPQKTRSCISKIIRKDCKRDKILSVTSDVKVQDNKLCRKLRSVQKVKTKTDIVPRITRRSTRMEVDDSDCEIIDVTPGVGNQTKHVCTHDLSKDQFDIIKNGDWLNDIHINLAHALLKEKFPRCGGLENCCLGNKKHQAFTPLKEDVRFVQMYNYNANHWLTITNYNCSYNEVKIYDSYFRSLRQDLKKVLFNLYGRRKGSLKVMWPTFQLQRATSDCGLFAIASACSVLHGEDPSVLTYQQSAMRRHLCKCFENKKMTPFLSANGKGAQLKEKVTILNLPK